MTGDTLGCEARSTATGSGALARYWMDVTAADTSRNDGSTPHF